MRWTRCARWWADLAVQDSAYGAEPRTADQMRRDFLAAVRPCVESSRPLLLPVPRYGRGQELLRMLADRWPGMPLYGDAHFCRQVQQLAPGSLLGAAPGQGFFAGDPGPPLGRRQRSGAGNLFSQRTAAGYPCRAGKPPDGFPGMAVWCSPARWRRALAPDSCGNREERFLPAYRCHCSDRECRTPAAVQPLCPDSDLPHPGPALCPAGGADLTLTTNKIPRTACSVCCPQSGVSLYTIRVTVQMPWSRRSGRHPRPAGGSAARCPGRWW